MCSFVFGQGGRWAAHDIELQVIEKQVAVRPLTVHFAVLFLFGAPTPSIRRVLLGEMRSPLVRVCALPVFVRSLARTEPLSQAQWRAQSCNSGSQEACQNLPQHIPRRLA